MNNALNKTATPTFTHNGAEITMLPNGKFTAMTAQGRITAASLDAVKKRLDKLGAFTPFRGFTIHTGYNFGANAYEHLRDCEVIGTIEPRSKYGSRQWKTRNGALSTVYEDTPANRAAAKAYIELCAHHRKVRELQDASANTLLKKLVACRMDGKDKP